MDKFDDRYVLLQSMYEDCYYPHFLVDKIKIKLVELIDFLARSMPDKTALQNKLDEFNWFMGDLQQELYAYDSSLENLGRECVAESVEYILRWFHADISPEDVWRERVW